MSEDAWRSLARNTKRRRIDSNPETDQARQSKRRKMPKRRRRDAGFPPRAYRFRPNLPQCVTGWRDRHRCLGRIRAACVAKASARPPKRCRCGRNAAGNIAAAHSLRIDVRRHPQKCVRGWHFSCSAYSWGTRVDDGASSGRSQADWPLIDAGTHDQVLAMLFDGAQGAHGKGPCFR